MLVLSTYPNLIRVVSMDLYTATFFCATTTTLSCPFSPIVVLPNAWIALNAYSAGLSTPLTDLVQLSLRGENFDSSI